MRLHQELDDLEQLVRCYDEMPSAGRERTDALQPLPAASQQHSSHSTTASRLWKRPDSLATGARLSCTSAFAARERSARTGSVDFASLPSRFNGSMHSTAMIAPSAASASTSLAESAAVAGVACAFGVGVSSSNYIQARPAIGFPFQSDAVRFAVALAERLGAGEAHRSSAASAEACHTSLEVLHDIIPLLGPLKPVLHDVHQTLCLCLLTKGREGSEALGKPESREERLHREARERAPASTEGRLPYFVLTRQVMPARRLARRPCVLLGPCARPCWFAQAGSPIWVQCACAQLEETVTALRLERDNALDDVRRTHEDVANLDEQLATAKAQLHTKTSTIDKLVREHASLEGELRVAKVRQADPPDALRGEARAPRRGCPHA